MNKRLSTGTPYILTTAEIDQTLRAVPERVEVAIAALMNMTVDDWRAQDKKARAKQIVDFQNTGALAATLAKSAKAVSDLESVALPTIQPTALPTDALIDGIIDGLHKRGLIVINPTTTQKKGA